MKFAMAASFLLTVSSAHAVRYLDGASVSSVIERGDNGFSACGIRVVVFDPVRDAPRFIDFSLRVLPDPYIGFVDFNTVRVAKGKLKSGQKPGVVVTPAPVKFWIAEETAAQRLSSERYVKSPTEGTALAVLQPSETLIAITDIARGKRMQFAITYSKVGKKTEDDILSFAAPLPDKEIDGLKACLTFVSQNHARL